MTKLSIALSFVLALALTAVAYGQTIVPFTTLSAAVTSTSSQANVFRLTSTSGITANNTMLFIDGEADFVNAVTSTTVTVTRGAGASSRVSTHASGATVWYGSPSYFQSQQPGGYPFGSCTRTGAVLPYIDINNNVISDCIGGVWVSGGANQNTNQFSVIYAPQPGAVIYTGIDTNGETLSATTMYCTEIDLQQSKMATGLAFLLGTTGGTSKHLGVLYDATGNLLANSATAGTTAGTASTYETLPFTTKYYLVGPAKYYGCLQTNGTTATVRMLITSVQDGYTTKGITGVTFGTVPSTITVPTTFTTAVGPYEQVY